MERGRVDKSMADGWEVEGDCGHFLNGEME